MSKPVKYGIVVGLVTIVWMLSIYFTHNQFSRLGLFSRLISYAFLIPALFMAMREKRDNELGGFITVKECMKAGMTVSLLAGVIVMVFTYVYYAFIDHEIQKFYQDLTEAHMKSEGKPKEEIAQAMGAIAEFYSPFRQATYVLMFTMITGAILSFICSTFVVKHPDESAN